MDPTKHSEPSLPSTTADEVLELFAEITDRAASVLSANTNWAESGRRAGQYAVDLDVDDVCVQPLLAAGFSVLSEESGRQPAPTATDSGTVVVDPLDGSTNASLGLPWFATALCLVVDDAPQVAMVTNLATGDRYSAIRGSGAVRNGQTITVADSVDLEEAIVAVNGLPESHWGWRQFRAMGAAALDISAVARGGFDGYVDATFDSHGVWDYLASVLIVSEAGGVAADGLGRDLVVLDHAARRTPVVASNQELLDGLLRARNGEGTSN